MNFTTEIVFLSFFLLQFSLSVFLLWLLVKQKNTLLGQGQMKKQENDLIVETFTFNCQKYFLTAREIEILKLIRSGLPYKLIACQLNISENTVGTHVKNMFSKVDVTNKMELVSKLSN